MKKEKKKTVIDDVNNFFGNFLKISCLNDLSLVNKSDDVMV
jgi:hypothetical protein